MITFFVMNSTYTSASGVTMVELLTVLSITAILLGLGLPQFRELLGDAPWHIVRSIPLPKHQLSHQTLHAVVHRIETLSLTPAAAAMAVPTVALGDYAVPRLIDRYLIKYQI